ncbi:MAG TPA: sugar ABC transporter substrate-binding protein [Ktedonobacteraceae bacterium]|nr:sugar ABC transporter substrate-binding protein [Ktedonobacteraceae bacterium]
MSLRFNRLTATILGVVIVLVILAIVLVSVVATRTGTQTPSTGKGHTGPYSIALSNSYIGNTWRVEMENEFKAACAMAPYKTLIKCTIYNAGNDVSKQTQQMDDLISSHVDAIVIDAASPTGLNGVIQQACNAGILVVSYDSIVTAPCALKVNTDQYKLGQQLAQYIVDALNGKGNVIMVTGVPGTSVDQERNQGAADVFKKYPNIKVIAQYTGQWASDVAERNTTAQLTSLDKIDAVWCQGGTDGVIRAILAAKRPMPTVIAGEAENGYREYMLQYKSQGLKALSIGQPPFLALVSLELASQILQGKHAKANIMIPFPFVTTDTVKEGETAFSNLPSSFFADFTDSGPNAVVSICVTAATQGQVCPDGVSVKLPTT